ncbi:amino acid ABC transporter permease [Ralstonia mannitolilytica]|uniref:amino acid ABC transporter permease n=1 Tax=Ralstonia mannitolilytica TaxID=105219 RepID=UPI001C97AFE2|nr:amino acid ABC transporter permease [Ralstonia mannitolilytica]MBY4717535.1 amino acid ABC transporter permease [Ralstonia mannitolilytica]
MNILQVFDSSHDLLNGLKITLELFLTGSVAGITLGSVLALARTGNNKILSSFVKGYINLFRSIPLVMVLIGFYMVIPRQLRAMGFYGDISLPAAFLSFAMFEAAYFAEIIRSGINAVPEVQKKAAQVLGLTKWQTDRMIVLPQALKNSYKSLTTQCITLLMDTSLVYVIGVSDFFTTAEHIGERDFNMDASILVATAVYIVLRFILQRAMNKLETTIFR